MIIILILFLATSFIGTRKRKDKNDIDYLDKRITGSICGVCVVLVFINHISSEINSSHFLDVPATFIVQVLLNQLMVVPFLFYSGYGATYQYMRKKKEYLKSFLIKRVLKVYLFYVMALLIRNLSTYLVNGCQTFPFNPIELVFPSFWYMFVILIEYLAIFLSFIIFKENKKGILISNIVVSVLLTLSLYLAGKETWWYNTTIAFSFGVFWALYREKLDKILAHKKSFIIIMVASILTLGLTGGGFWYSLFVIAEK